MSELSTPMVSARAERVIARCRELARCTEVPGETTRVFLSPSMKRVHELIAAWMHAAGMSVRLDAIGNLRGLLPATTPNAPRLLIGSHLDTVPNAGAFDGILGVVLALALIEEIETPLSFAIELVGFSEEEGVRFAKPFLGSLALIGELDSEALARTDAHGLTVTQAIRAFGLDPAELSSAIVDDHTFAYLEFHIEQGPVLESECTSLGVVDAIAGQSRFTLTFMGQANHAGTTPMGVLRHDALAAVAQWITEVERYANACPGLIATVGRLEVPGGAVNVVPGKCIATLDIRHASDGVRQAAVQHCLDSAQFAASTRGVSLAQTQSLDQPAVPMDAALSALLTAAARAATGKQPRAMSSGAGHDAMILARRVPAAMLFLRSPAGLSHHPDESVVPADVEAAIATGVEFLRRLRDDRTTLARFSALTSASRRENIHA